MADAKVGFIDSIKGPDTLQKADAFRILGIWMTSLSAIAVLASALILRDVSFLLFLTLGFGGFYVFIAGEMRRRLTIQHALAELRAEVSELKGRLQAS